MGDQFQDQNTRKTKILSKREKFVTKNIKRKWKKDSIYTSIWFNKLTNNLMLDGKKSIIENNIFRVNILLKYILNKIPVFFFFEILELISPHIELIPKRLGRDWFKIPIPIKLKRSNVLANSWIKKSIIFSSRNSIILKIYCEFLNLYIYRQSNSLKKKEQVYNLSIQNITHNNFRWK